MGKGRTSYCIDILGDINVADQTIKNYLASTGFKLTEKNGEQFYKYVAAVDEFPRGFKYYFEGKKLNISVWLINFFGQDVELNKSSMDRLSMEYNESLSKLFQDLANVEPTVQNETNNQNNASQFVQNFQDDVEKKKERRCEVVFWISIFSLILAFFGYVVAVIVYVCQFYYAILGLKTRKKGKAIATIILSAASILILMLEVLFM